MVSLFSSNDGCKRAQRKVNAWVWDQIGLERLHVNGDGTVKTERGRNGRDRLSDQSVKIGVSGSLNIKITTANVVQRLVVYHEGNIGVLEHTMRAQDGVVWLNNGRGDLW